MTSGDVGGNTHKPLPYFIWTTAFTTVTQWMAAPTATVCFPLKSNNVRPWETVPTSRWHARVSPHNLFWLCPHLLLWAAVSVWVYSPSVIAPLCNHIPPRPIPGSDEHWQGGRKKTTRPKYGSNYKQKDVRRGWQCKLTTAARQWKHWWLHMGTWCEPTSLRSTSWEQASSQVQRLGLIMQRRSWNSPVFEVRKSNCWRDKERRQGKHHLCSPRLHGRNCLEVFYFELLTLEWVNGIKNHYHLKAHAHTKQSDNTSWLFPVSKVRCVHL